MKKFLVSYLILAVGLWLVAPALVMADSGTSEGTADTTLLKDSGTTSNPPVIKAKWEMRAERSGDSIANRVGVHEGVWFYEDAPGSNNPGAQFLPSGDDQIDTDIEVCSVVAHPGVQDLEEFVVSADIYYPEVKGLRPEKEFCGDKINQIQLLPLTKANGLRLVCGDGTYDGIQQNDASLPKFSSGYKNDYIDICEELEQEEAKVFCGPITISYEAPEGMYDVFLYAMSPDGDQVSLNNQFEYLPLEAFKTDFTQIDYGTVGLKTFHTVSGDRDMVADSNPTIQGTGNTVLEITVSQDDMGFGTRLVDGNTESNVKYKARLDSTPIWDNLDYYDPDTDHVLVNNLDLSQVQKLDFGVYVEKFPPEHTSDTYSGTVTLSADKVQLESCSN